MGKYPDRASNVRALLTPQDKNCWPRGSFSELREKFERGPFETLTEPSAERAARELNAFMLSIRSASPPKQVKDNLARIEYLASALVFELECLDGVSASALLGVEDPVAPLSLPGAPELANNNGTEPYKIAFAPELRALVRIDEREFSRARETTDKDQLASLTRYDARSPIEMRVRGLSTPAYRGSTGPPALMG